jgi:hypothetical protein
MTKSKRKARAAKKDVKRTEKVIFKSHGVLRKLSRPYHEINRTVSNLQSKR